MNAPFLFFFLIGEWEEKIFLFILAFDFLASLALMNSLTVLLPLVESLSISFSGQG